MRSKRKMSRKSEDSGTVNNCNSEESMTASSQAQSNSKDKSKTIDSEAQLNAKDKSKEKEHEAQSNSKDKSKTLDSEEASPTKRLRVRKEDHKTETQSNARNKSKGREYEVEAIIGQKKSKNGDKFLVKWKGYNEKQNTWEPKSNLNCQKLLDDFLKNKK